MDLYGWGLDISDRANMNPILPKIADRARDKFQITVRRMSRRRLRRDMDEFATVYNAAWSGNWGFVPYSKADLDAYTIDMQLVFDRNWYMIAEIDGKTIAMAITIPDINQVYKKMQGRLLPLGWFHYLNRARITDRVRIGFLGVLPEYQHTGVAAAALHGALRHRRAPAPEPRRGQLHPGDQQRDEPRPGGDGRPHPQALAGLRAPARGGRRPVADAGRADTDG